MRNQRIRGRSLVVSLVVLLGACAPTAEDPTTTSAAATSTTALSTTTSLPATTTTQTGHSHSGDPDKEAVVAAMLAAAGYQDVAVAEAAGYASTMEGLGCFENADLGGMGLHLLNESIMDAELDVASPEALVYELDANGEIVGLVAHEYIVPVEAWTESTPPEVFGMELHQHPVLPLWVLHAWLWKDNPAGFFSDWNPAVRLCPEGVPVFGVDLP